VLSGELQTIDPEADVQQALRLMSSHQIRRLPVVEEDVLVGMVSLGDIAVKNEDRDSAGEALSEVSEGVKQEGRGETRSRAKQRGSRPQNQATGCMQAISNRSPREEQSRQARVSPARSQKRPAVRSRNRSARQRKAS
jgi:CBS-domain-containing membrane protein